MLKTNLKKDSRFFTFKYFIINRNGGPTVMGYRQKRSVKLYLIGGFFVLLFLLVADFSIDPQDWSLLGLLLWGCIMGTMHTDQA